VDSASATGHIPAMQFTVIVCRDDMDGVWFVESSDLPGLNAEAPTLDALVEAIEDLAPDLIATNVPGVQLDGTSAIPVCVQHIVTARPAHAA
jgi:hypothetical protein